MSLLAIIVPCYNESERLNIIAFNNFINSNKFIFFYFVNDGSSDNTYYALMSIYNSNPLQVCIINLKKNVGKGEAVRRGFLDALNRNFEYIGYLDADLATPPSEFIRLVQLINTDTEVLFGSRIKKAGSLIQRSGFRHLTGRVIATIIDKRFKLGFYDTQCGAKIFKLDILQYVINKPFYTSWLFDVEIFLRINRQFSHINWHEEPLKVWSDDGNSKLNFFSIFKILKELLVLLKKYRP